LIVSSSTVLILEYQKAMLPMQINPPIAIMSFMLREWIDFLAMSSFITSMRDTCISPPYTLLNFGIKIQSGQAAGFPSVKIAVIK
jgi:hypothetical protein